MILSLHGRDSEGSFGMQNQEMTDSLSDRVHTVTFGKVPICAGVWISARPVAHSRCDAGHGNDEIEEDGELRMYQWVFIAFDTHLFVIGNPAIFAPIAFPMSEAHK